MYILYKVNCLFTFGEKKFKCFKTWVTEKKLLPTCSRDWFCWAESLYLGLVTGENSSPLFKGENLNLLCVFKHIFTAQLEDHRFNFKQPSH